MRKIKSIHDIERARRRNNIILGLVMIFLLVISSLGYSLMSSDEDNENIVNEFGFDFVRSGGLWKLNVGGQVFGFQNLPSELSEINVNLTNDLGTYSNQPLYFVNPNEGVSEILGNINGYILRYQEACLENYSDDCRDDLPVKDCSNNLVVFESGDESRVYSEDNCVFVVGDSVKGSDAFLYKILGIVG